MSGHEVLAQGSAVVMAALLVLAWTAVSDACTVPPYSCPEYKCSQLPTRFPNPSNDFSKSATWTSPALQHVGNYRGVFNKLLYGGSKPPASTLASWLALRGSSVFVNIERFPVETPYVLSTGATTSLEGCCNLCRTTQGCVEYLFQPYNTTANALLDKGNCTLLTGGVYKGDGPFDKVTGYNYGTPNSSTNTYQQDRNRANKNIIGYLGGYCNPGNTTVNVHDDPHFTGARGTRFDFNGALNTPFCLVTDRALHINALLKGYKDDNPVGATVGTDGKALRTWIKELGILWTDDAGRPHSLHLVARGGKESSRGEEGFLARAVLDGEPLPVPNTPGAAVTDEAWGFSFTFMGTSKKGPYDVDRFTLGIGTQLDATLSLRAAHAALQTADDAEVHFNLLLNDLAATPRVHGVLGQTFRRTPAQEARAQQYADLARVLGGPIQADGDTGAGFLDGTPEDYQTSHVLAADCKVSTYTL